MYKRHRTSPANKWLPSHINGLIASAVQGQHRSYLVEKRQDLARRQVEVLLAVRDAALLQAQADQDGGLPVGHGRGQPLGKKGPHQEWQQVQDQVMVHQVVGVRLHSHHS